VLTENPDRNRDAAVAGIRETSGLAPDARSRKGLIEAVKMGTTFATNALWSARAARAAAVNRGFADMLRIGNQARPPRCSTSM